MKNFKPSFIICVIIFYINFNSFVLSRPAEPSPSFWDSIPIISQMKSLVQLMGGDEEGARKTWMNFFDKGPVISQVKSDDADRGIQILEKLRTNPVLVSRCNNGVPFKRSACGYQGIREADCTKNGCCWDDSVPNAKFCFDKFKKETLLTYSEKDCEAFGLLKGCNDINIRALGEIQKSDKHLASTFGGRTDVFAHEGGVGASAHAHLADITQELGPFELGVNVGKIGAGGYATLDKGVGLGLSATLAEAGGGVGLKTPGLGWVGIGGKVGLSADTAVKFGPETEVKILGSGVSVSSSKGVELCLFGSCVWIG